MADQLIPRREMQFQLYEVLTPQPYVKKLASKSTM